MKCSKFLRNFSDYLEGELDPETLSTFEAHLRQCPNCSRLVSAYRNGVAFLPEMPLLEPPADLYQRVATAVSQPHQAWVVRLRRPRFWVPAAAAAAVLTALLSFSFHSSNESAFLNDLAVVDSTMDVVNLPVMEKYSQSLQEQQLAKTVRLVSYTPVEEEPVLSYGVSRHPVFIVSGVYHQGD